MDGPIYAARAAMTLAVEELRLLISRSSHLGEKSGGGGGHPTAGGGGGEEGRAEGEVKGVEEQGRLMDAVKALESVMIEQSKLLGRETLRSTSLAFELAVTRAKLEAVEPALERQLAEREVATRQAPYAPHSPDPFPQSSILNCYLETNPNPNPDPNPTPHSNPNSYRHSYSCPHLEFHMQTCNQPILLQSLPRQAARISSEPPPLPYPDFCRPVSPHGTSHLPLLQRPSHLTSPHHKTPFRSSSFHVHQISRHSSINLLGSHPSRSPP